MPGMLTNVCSLQVTQAWPETGVSRMPICKTAG